MHLRCPYQVAPLHYITLHTVQRIKNDKNTPLKDLFHKWIYSSNKFWNLQIWKQSHPYMILPQVHSFGCYPKCMAISELEGKSSGKLRATPYSSRRSTTTTACQSHFPFFHRQLIISIFFKKNYKILVYMAPNHVVLWHLTYRASLRRTLKIYIVIYLRKILHSHTSKQNAKVVV